MHSAGRRPAEIMSIIQRRFFVESKDGRQMNIDEIKNKGLYVYDPLITKKNYY